MLAGCVALVVWLSMHELEPKQLEQLNKCPSLNPLLTVIACFRLVCAKVAVMTSLVSTFAMHITLRRQV